MKRLGALLVAAGVGCGQAPDAAGAPGLVKARARGALVAKVDGAAVGIDQVRELARSAGLAPREALARLEEELLLAAEAERRGYARTRATREDEKRALVQALLARTVELVRAQDVPAEEVRARFDGVAKRAGLLPESFPEHEPAVRAQLLLEKQKEVLEKLTRSLRERIGVQLSEPEVQKLLADPKFWGDSA